MRKIITNILTTTAISLLVLSLIALCYRAKFLCIESVFQAFFANILIHLGIKWMQRIDFNYPIAESLLSIGYTIMVALVCGKVFHWYDSMPVQVLALLAGIVMWLMTAQNQRLFGRHGYKVLVKLQRS